MMKRWIWVAAIGLPAAALGGGYLWLRKNAPALAPSLGTATRTPKFEQTQGGFFGIKKDTAGGPWSATRIGRVVDGASMDYGEARRTTSGAYKLEWNQIIWLSDKPGRNPQYFNWGAAKNVEVRAYALSWWQAESWLDAMHEQPSSEAIWEIEIKQYAIVDPWPPQKKSIYDCTKNAPGADAAKNIACARWRGSRNPIAIRVYESAEVPGWYFARWKFGPLAAGPDLEEVKSVATQAAKRINEGKVSP